MVFAFAFNIADYNLKLPFVDGFAQAECLPLSYIVKFSETEADALDKNVTGNELRPNKAMLGRNPIMLIDEGLVQEVAILLSYFNQICREKCV